MVFLAFFALITLGRVPLIDEDEGEYSEVAAEMAASENFLAPTLNGQPFYEKPALLFWLQAPLVQLVGPKEWVFRLPPFLASLAWVITVLGWWRKRGEAREPELAAWIGVCTLGMTIAGRAATMDSLIILWLTATLFDLWCFIETDQRIYLRRAACWMALGFLTKGPMALVIPFLVMGGFLICSPRYRDRWRGLWDGWAWAIFLVVAAPWFIWYGMHSQGMFFQYFLFRENLGRVGGSLQGHSGSPMYYLIVLPLLLLPYSAVLFRLIKAIPKNWSSPLKRYLMIWFFVVLAVFTLAGTKLPHYLLYGCTPLFLLAAAELLKPGKALWRWLLVLPSVLLPAVSLVLPAIVAHFALNDSNPYIREMLGRGAEIFTSDYYRNCGLWALLTVLFGLRLVWTAQNSKNYPYYVLLPAMAAAIGVSWILIPAVTHLQQDPVRAAAQFAKTLNLPIVSDNRMPSFSVYLGRPTERRQLKTGDIAFGRLDHPGQLGSQYQTLFAQGGVRIVKVLQP
jgi:4-amino-4-deoxy-L-arabinose transferase-like glycosyltransferase